MSKEPERAQLPAPFVLAPQRTDGEPYTTSEIIAEGTGIGHRKLRDTIRKYKAEIETFGLSASYQAESSVGGISGAYATELKVQKREERRPTHE